MREVFASAWREIRRRRVRSLWAVFGYATSVCLLVTAVSVLMSAREKARSTLWTTGTQFIGFIVDRDAAWERWRDPVRQGFQAHNNPTRLFPMSRVEEMRKSPHVRHAAPILGFRIQADASRAWMVVGFDPTDMESVRCMACSDSEIVEGDALLPGDAREALLEQTFAAAERLRVGDKFELAGQFFRVKGLMGPGARPVKADVYLPLNEAVLVVNTRLKQPLEGEVNMVLVDGMSSPTHGRTVSEAKRILGPDSATIGYDCWQPSGEAVGIGLSGMGGLALLIAAFFVVWTLLSQAASVRERGRDIGVLKAIGWTDDGVVAQIAAETLILAVLGGAAGTIAAALLLAWPPAVRWLAVDAGALYPFRMWIPLAGLCMTVSLGLLSAIFVARLVAGIRPADMLRRA